jgi:alcohol dehydrogenase
VRPYEGSQPLVLETVTADRPADGEVLVRIAAASLCRSDLSVVSGVRRWPLPIVPGHEASGEVVETGPGVASVAVGDHVVLVFQPACGACDACRTGEPHLCGPGLAANRRGELLGGGSRLYLDDLPVHHHMGVSAFAKYAVVSEHSVVPVPRDLPWDHAALFGCAVMCGAGTVINTAGVRPGDRVAIVGMGGVGQSALLGARVAGADRVIAVDGEAGKLAHAQRLGATDVVRGDTRDAAATVAELTGGGVDVAIEAAGTLAAFEIAHDATRRGGTVVSVGLVDPSTPFHLDIAGLVTSARTIRGSYMGSCNPRLDVPRFVALHQQGRFPVEELISDRMPLADVNLALDRMSDGTAVRQILVP